MDLKKCWGVENVWGYANKFCVWILKKIGGGVVVMPKYFIDLKKCWGGYAAVCQNILGIWKKCWWGGSYAQILCRLEKCWGGGMPTNLWT